MARIRALGRSLADRAGSRGAASGDTSPHLLVGAHFSRDVARRAPTRILFALERFDSRRVSTRMSSSKHSDLGRHPWRMKLSGGHALRHLSITVLLVSVLAGCTSSATS